MAERRDFLRSLAAFAATPGSRRSVGAQHAAPLPTPGVTGGPTDREYWLDVLTRLAQPVLTNLAQGRLRQRMPVETAPARTRSAATTRISRPSGDCSPGSR